MENIPDLARKANSSIIRRVKFENMSEIPLKGCRTRTGQEKFS